MSGGIRAGIVTIQDDRNFGNRLQNFALQEALGSLGWEVESIRNAPPPMGASLLASRAIHALRADGPLQFGRRNAVLALGKITRRHATTSRPSHESRNAPSIARFAREHIRISDDDYLNKPPSFWRDRYDVAVVGSDQVWNHGFRNAHELDFLTFASPESRVAYAASFGVPEVPRFLWPKYRKWLDGIPHLSVREQRGSEIIRDLTGRDVPVVLDPTLLHGCGWWDALTASQSASLPGCEPSAVQFFLGKAGADQEDWVAALARERGVQLIDLNAVKDGQGIGPLEFVAALSRADFVATDSFHAGVFSLLHHRPVVIRSRDRTDSRLGTLLDHHGIVPAETGVSGLSAALDPDWGMADTRLEAERINSWAFLRRTVGTPTTRSTT